MKIIKKVIFCLLLLLFIPIVYGLTIDKSTIIHASGQSIGIKIDSGVVIKKMYEINVDGKTYKPWDGILEENDKIIELNDKKINTLKDIKDALDCDKKLINIKVVRKNNVYSDQIEVVKNKNNVNTLGLVLKDGIMGVGTLTYVLDDSSCGSLGHQISQDDIKGGEIYESNVKSINKSSDRNIGGKNAEILDYKIGDVYKNTKTGVYGKNIKDYESRDYLVGFKEEVVIGPAKILTTLNKDYIEEFDVEIIEVYNQNDVSTKSMKIKVVDQDLIDKAGGIVQGMSGSPIIQNNKIIGALTHVIVDNPTEGYGIYIEWMLKDNGCDIKK